jgi:hypothetical protein
VEKPNRPPGPSAVDIIFWQVSGGLIGGSAGSAAAVWAAVLWDAGFDPITLATVAFLGLALGGACGTLWCHLTHR